MKIFKGIKEFFLLRRAKKEMKKHGHELFFKFTHDVWPNVFILNDGYWCIAQSFRHFERNFGGHWVELELAEETMLTYQLDPNKNLNAMGYRRFVINTVNIIAVMEFDS